MRRKALLSLLLVFVATLPVCAGKEAETTGESPAKAPADVAAYLGSEAISMDEVNKVVAGELQKLRQQEYDLRRRAVDQIVAEKLLNREADSRGIGLEELFKVEVEAKAVEPTGDAIKQFYEANKGRYPQIRDKSLEEATPFVKQALQQQSMMERQRAFLDELRAKQSVRVLLDPPRVEVPIPASAPARGPETAPVTIVEFSDFQCGYCKRAHPAVEGLLAEYGDRVRFVYRDFALSFHDRAAPAAEAALCAGDQDKYWDYYNDLMKTPSDLSDEDLRTRAARVGLDEAKFDECVASDRHVEAVEASMRQGQSLGVTGTPTFFINGRMLVGAVPVEQIREVIEDELQRASGS